MWKTLTVPNKAVNWLATGGIQSAQEYCFTTSYSLSES